MLKYTLKRLVMAIPVMLGIVTIVFFLMRVFSPNPAYLLLGPRATAEKAAELSSYLGLDQPLWKQYVIYLKQMLQGDFGTSLFSGAPVLQEVMQRMPATIELAIVSVIMASVLGIALGVICAVEQNSWLDRIAQIGGLVGISMPRFWLGLMLILAFAVNRQWLPVSGRYDFMNQPAKITGLMIFDSIVTGNWSALWSTIRYLTLPAFSIGISLVGTIMRYTRSTMLETIRQDYIRTAYAKGLRKNIVIMRHALKNALIPIVTVIGMQLGGLLGGSVLAETIFAWPGIGKYIVDGINNSDYAVVQGGCLLVALISVVMNLVIDLLYGVLDPRIRY